MRIIGHDTHIINCCNQPSGEYKGEGERDDWSKFSKEPENVQWKIVPSCVFLDEEYAPSRNF